MYFDQKRWFLEFRQPFVLLRSYFLQLSISQIFVNLLPTSARLLSKAFAVELTADDIHPSVYHHHCRHTPHSPILITLLIPALCDSLHTLIISRFCNVGMWSSTLCSFCSPVSRLAELRWSWPSWEWSCVSKNVFDQVSTYFLVL